jgi:hypothetical protein
MMGFAVKYAMAVSSMLAFTRVSVSVSVLVPELELEPVLSEMLHDASRVTLPFTTPWW